jgi:CRP-like cAMP-binding protein
MLLTYQNTKQGSEKSSSTERRLHFYERGEEIPLISQGIWQVCQGVVQLGTFNPSGEETLLGWVQPLGFFGLWLTSIDVYHARALSEVYLKWYSINEIESSPNLSQTVLNQLVLRLRQTEALLAISGIRLVEQRLIKLLTLLKREFGEPTEGGTRLGVRFTHQNIANVIGTTRVTVTRLLGEFQRQGLISFDGDRHLVIYPRFTDDQMEELAFA